MQLPVTNHDFRGKVTRVCVAVVAVLIFAAIVTTRSGDGEVVQVFVAISLFIGAGIAVLSAWRRNRGAVFGDDANVAPRKPLPLFGPDMLILHRPHIGAHPVGGVLALGLAAYLFIALPESRVFILLTIVLGFAVGFVLWLRHR